MHDHELDSLTTVAHEGCAVQHCNASRSDASTCSILHAQRNRTQWHNHLAMHCQSASCVLELCCSSSLHGRPGALSTDRGVARATTHGPKYHHLIFWATLLSHVGRPTQLRLVTCDDADNMCSPGSRSHYTGQFNWQLSVTIAIWLAMLGALSVDSASQ
jgi:hypothetical protein